MVLSDRMQGTSGRRAWSSCGGTHAIAPEPRCTSPSEGQSASRTPPGARRHRRDAVPAPQPGDHNLPGVALTQPRARRAHRRPPVPARHLDEPAGLIVAAHALITSPVTGSHVIRQPRSRTGRAHLGPPRRSRTAGRCRVGPVQARRAGLSLHPSGSGEQRQRHGAMPAARIGACMPGVGDRGMVFSDEDRAGGPCRLLPAKWPCLPGTTARGWRPLARVSPVDLRSRRLSQSAPGPVKAATSERAARVSGCSGPRTRSRTGSRAVS